MAEAEAHPGGWCPFVRVVVLNWNSAWFTRRCVEALQRTEHPADHFEVVVVDNGSVDGSLERLRAWFPDLRIIANGANLGFAEGCNRGMRDRTGVDAVALINNDAVVDPGWLVPLVEALDGDPRIGAASACLVLEPGFIPIDVEAERTVTVRSVRTDGWDVTAAVRADGFEAVSDATWPLDVTRRLRHGRGRLWIPAAPGVRGVTIAFEGGGNVSATSGVETVGGPAGREITIAVSSERINLLNGIGTARNERCEGYDRHYGIPEGESGEESEALVDVEGVCGGAALLRSTMLDEVGLLDARLFAYYEDTDLSWRASRAGWRLVAVPRSRVAHAFGAAGGSRAPGFFHLDRRNWWLTAERNGTPEQRRVVRSEVRREVRTAVRANVAGRLRRRRPPSLLLVGAWARIIADHRIELARRDHPSRGFPGVRATRSVLGRFQPRPRPGIPAARPWGPVPVRIDVTALVERSGSTTLQAAGWTATRRDDARRVVRVLLQEHPELDVITLVEDRSGASVVAGPREVAELLGIRPVGPTPADAPIPAPDDPAVVLWLDQEAPAVPRSGPGPMTIVAGPDAEPAAVAAALVAAHHPSGERRTTASGA